MSLEIRTNATLLRLFSLLVSRAWLSHLIAEVLTYKKTKLFLLQHFLMWLSQYYWNLRVDFLISLLYLQTVVRVYTSDGMHHPVILFALHERIIMWFHLWCNVGQIFISMIRCPRLSLLLVLIFNRFFCDITSFNVVVDVSASNMRVLLTSKSFISHNFLCSFRFILVMKCTILQQFVD